MSSITLPRLHDIPGGIDALADFFLPKAFGAIEQSRSLVEAVLKIQEISNLTYQEYARLYRTDIETITEDFIDQSTKAGFSSLFSVKGSTLSLVGNLRNNKTRKRSLVSIKGIDHNKAIGIAKLNVRIRAFLLVNVGRTPIRGIKVDFPEDTYLRERRTHLKNFKSRLVDEKCLDSRNTFINTYVDFLGQIEKAIFHELLYPNKLFSRHTFLIQDVSGNLYEKESRYLDYLLDCDLKELRGFEEEWFYQSLKKAWINYDLAYHKQFIIHKEKMEEMQSIFQEV